MLNQAAVALGLCFVGVMTAAVAAPAVDAKAEREAAVKVPLFAAASRRTRS